MADNNGENRRQSDSILRMTTDIVTAYAGKNNLNPGQLPEVIRTVYQSLNSLGSAPTASASAANSGKPAVPVKRSVTPEYIVCLEDGKKLKMLKRHLRTVYGMSPEQYRAKWGLPVDYPMVAPKYAEVRSAFAKKIGLGKGASGSSRRKRAA